VQLRHQPRISPGKIFHDLAKTSLESAVKLNGKGHGTDTESGDEGSDVFKVPNKNGTPFIHSKEDASNEAPFFGVTLPEWN
jgi:hypothetical protein